MKTKIIFRSIGVLLVSSAYFYFLSNFSFSDPVGGWEQSKAKTEAKYGYSKKVKHVALQLKEAYQKIIDDSEDISKLSQIDNGMACIYGVLISQGVGPLIQTTPGLKFKSLLYRAMNNKDIIFALIQN